MAVLCKSLLLCAFPIVMFITTGKMITIIILLCCEILTYDTTTSVAIKLN